MAIEAVFLNLRRKIDALRDALQALALTAIEDRPQRGEVLLVERFGNLVDELRGWGEEAREAAIQASDALAHPADLSLARRALGVASERFIRLEYRFFDKATAHGAVSELMSFGQESGGGWASWTTEVARALNVCRTPVKEVDRAIFHAWQELSERLAARSITVHTSNIGQQISAPAAEGASAQSVTSRVERTPMTEPVTPRGAPDASVGS